MSKEIKDIIVVVFETVDGARHAFETLADVRGGSYVRIEDTAVVYKDADGHVKTDNQVSHGGKVTAWGTGGVGLLVGLLLGGPVIGLAAGLLGAGLISRFAKMGIDGSFVKQVRDELKPETSALFLLSKPEARDLLIAAMTPLQGTLYYTSLPPEAEELLRENLQ